jgi:hypothetical protein
MKMKNKTIILSLFLIVFFSITSLANSNINNNKENNKIVLHESDFSDENEDNNDNYVKTEMNDKKSDLDSLKENIEDYVKTVDDNKEIFNNSVEKGENELSINSKNPKELATDTFIFLKNAIIDNIFLLILLGFLYIAYKKNQKNNPKINKNDND